MIIANTIKGKGVSIFEGLPQFHNAALEDDQYAQAEAETRAAVASLAEGGA